MKHLIQTSREVVAAFRPTAEHDLNSAVVHPLLACRKSTEETASNDGEANRPPPRNQLATEKEGKLVSERQGADSTGGAAVAGRATQESQGDGEAQSRSAASTTDESTKADVAGGDGGGAEAKVAEMDETKEACSRGDENVATGSSTGEKTNDGGGEAGEAGGGASTLVETGAAKSKQEKVVKSDDGGKPLQQVRMQQQLPPSEEKRHATVRAQDPQGNGLDVAGGSTVVVQAEGKRAICQVDSSDEEDDGFRVVVGREVAPATVTPVVPTKRFLRGEDLVCDTKQCIVLHGKG